MALPVQSGTPLDVPASIHLILWPALIAWIALLVRLRRNRPPLRSSRLGFALAPLTFLADVAVLSASLTWPTPASNSFVFALLWLAILLSLTTYLLLRAPDDGDDGGSEDHEDPEPPWWPEFERRFRDYARGGPRAPSPDPRTPAGTSA
jgi:hypothetical protein